MLWYDIAKKTSWFSTWHPHPIYTGKYDVWSPLHPIQNNRLQLQIQKKTTDLYRLTDRSTDRPTHLSTNLPVNRSNNRHTDLPTDKRIYRLCDRQIDMPTDLRPTNRLTNEYIYQRSTDTPIYRPTYRLINTERPIYRLIYQPIAIPTDLPTNRTTDRLIYRPIDTPTDQLTYRSTDRPICQSAGQPPTDRPTDRSI